ATLLVATVALRRTATVSLAALFVVSGSKWSVARIATRVARRVPPVPASTRARSTSETLASRAMAPALHAPPTYAPWPGVADRYVRPTGSVGRTTIPPAASG